MITASLSIDHRRLPVRSDPFKLYICSVIDHSLLPFHMAGKNEKGPLHHP